MAGNARFHNKWHRRNHHSSPSIGYPDSGTDPIASYEEPFIGDFVTYNSISAQENLYIDGNATIQGNLSVYGDFSYFETVVSVTSALSVVNHGTGPAATIKQYGAQPIARFVDGDANGGELDALFIDDNGLVIVDGNYPAYKYDSTVNAVTSMNFTVSGNAYATKAFIWEKPDGNTVYVSTTGSDLNSGLNPSQKVKTIKKACQIVFNKYGTNKATIQVEAGDYTEKNPIYVPAGTSLIGEAFLRRTSLRPYNKQLDFFWLNTACYIWGFTFRDTWEPCAATAFPNLLSGTPAYRVAFQTPGYEIDVSKPGGPFGLPIVSKPYITTSPYTQGCSSITNYLRVPIQPDLFPSYYLSGAQTFYSFNESINVSKLFKIITDTLSAGAVPSPLPTLNATTTFTTSAVTLMLQASAGIQTAAINYINSNSPPPFYNQAKCKRDIGYFIDAVAYDLTNGTPLSTSTAASYYLIGAYSPIGGLPSNQIDATIRSFNFVRDQILDVIQPGSLEDNRIDFSFDTIASIIESNGVVPTVSSTVPSVGRDVAVTLLTTNSAFIQSSTVRYVNSNYPTLAYDQDKCFRDVGFIIESVIHDLNYNTNLSSISAGEYYFNYSGASVLPADQRVQTVDAIRFAKSVAKDVVGNVALKTYEQLFNNSLTLGYQATSYITSEFNTINSIIRNGTGTLPPVVTYTPPAGNSQAAYLLTINKPFIQKTVVNYVDKTFPGFSYNKDTCERDAGLIIDSIVTDLTLGTNINAISAGRFYFKGNKSLILGQETQTIAALNYASYLANKVVTNAIAVTGQAFAPFLSSGYLAADYVEKSFDTINRIIITGEKPSNQTANYSKTTGYLASSFMVGFYNTIANVISSGGVTPPIVGYPPIPGASDARDLLILNKEFIQRSVVDYVDMLYPRLSYNKASCFRDVGYIVEAVASDLVNYTNLSSVSAGGYYYLGSVSQIPGEESPTFNAIRFASELSVNVISNNLIPFFGQKYDFTKTAGNTMSGQIETAYTLISGTILNGVGTYTPSPATFIPNVPGAVNAAYLLSEANVRYIQSEVINFVNTTYPTFRYNTASCFRDSEYLTDAVSYDLTQGNYLSTTNAANYYYLGGKSLVTGQQKQTAAAAEYAGKISQYIASNTLIPNRSNAAELLRRNKVFIQKEVIEYITKAYPKFVYNQNKCERDVGYILDAVIHDVTYGGVASAIYAGNYYYSGTTSLIPNQEVETAAAINYAKYLALQVIKNQPVKNIGAGCGIRVDGELALGFLRSFVTDSFTQFNAGGKGIHIINCGYAQLVSTFTICTTEGIITERGGQCSISTSNCSFGLSGLVAVGKSTFPVLTGVQTVTTPLAENFLIVQDVTPRPLSAFVAALQAGRELEGIPLLSPYNGLLVNVQGDPASDFDEFLNPGALTKYHSIKSVSALPVGPYPPNTYRLTLEQNIQVPLTASNNEPKYVEFYLRSAIATSSHAFEYIGTGIDLELAVPALGGRTINENEAVFSDNGIVYYSSTNERGDFKVGGGFKVVQEKGTVEGLDFNKSILALVTPLILSLD